MEENKFPHRREPTRSLTWPPASAHAPTTDPVPTKEAQKSASSLPSIAVPQRFTRQADGTTPFEEDLNTFPENHFLSPIQMYEYEDWADDSDSDDGELEWDAGITDFALFADDRRRAQESGQELPSKWAGLLEQQASALQRSVQRSRAKSDRVNVPTILLNDEEVPSLTPDDSPDLRDDLDVESFPGQSMPRPSIPNYLTGGFLPPDEDDEPAIEEDEDMPLSVFWSHKKPKPKPRLQRPGMRHSRTMSGRIHAWTRPGWNIYTLGEDPEAEERAEQEPLSDDEERGRR